MANEALEAKLARRNGESVMVTLGQMNVKLAELQDRVGALTTTIGMLSARLMAAEQYIAMERIKAMGTGPTRV